MLLSSFFACAFSTVLEEVSDEIILGKRSEEVCREDYRGPSFQGGSLSFLDVLGERGKGDLQKPLQDMDPRPCRESGPVSFGERKGITWLFPGFGGDSQGERSSRYARAFGRKARGLSIGVFGEDFVDRQLGLGGELLQDSQLPMEGYVGGDDGGWLWSETRSNVMDTWITLDELASGKRANIAMENQ